MIEIHGNGDDEPAAPGSSNWLADLFMPEFPAQSGVCRRKDCGDSLDRLPGGGWLTTRDRFPFCGGHDPKRGAHEPAVAERGIAGAAEEHQLIRQVLGDQDGDSSTL